MPDLIALGELLVDLVQTKTAQGRVYTRHAGGAPANVLFAYARLGGSCAFVGKVGSDPFGRYLKEALCDAGIASDALQTTDNVLTTVAFVHLDKEGERSFSFFRHPGADTMLTPKEVPHQLIFQASIFHFGSLSLCSSPAREATLAAIQTARDAGCLISYDPNDRPLLWPDRTKAKAIMCSVLDCVDVIKVSEEELLLLSDENDFASATKVLLARGVKLVLVTQGSKGAWYATASTSGFVPAFMVQTVDTTGAGDAFMGAFLFQLTARRIADLKKVSSTDLAAMVRFSNAAGALTTTCYGGMPTFLDAAKVKGLCGQEAGLGS